MSIIRNLHLGVNFTRVQIVHINEALERCYGINIYFYKDKFMKYHRKVLWNKYLFL